MRAYTTAKLGPKRAVTPDGWLVCYDVPLATTGDLLYFKGELRDEMGQEVVQAGANGQIVVTRTADSLFRDETITSALGKAATYTHPPGNRVTKENYARVMKGSIVNPRRGTGADDNALMGDIVFYDQQTIDAITAGKVKEVSLGYDASYQQVEPGRAIQTDITINHVAVVPKGRCGPRCAIGDEKPMTLKERLAALKATIAEAIRTGDAAPVLADIEAAEKEIPAPVEVKPEVHTADAAILTALNGISERLTALEGAEKARVEAIATADAAAREAVATTDAASAALIFHYPGSRAKEIAANAEILAPGFKPDAAVTTADAAAVTVDCATALCNCQRTALARAYASDGKAKEAIKAVLAGREPAFDTMEAATVDSIFTGAAVIVSAANNAVASAKAGTADTKHLTPAQRMAAGVQAVWANPANS